MELLEVIEDTFVLLPTDWPVDKAHRFLGGQEFTHIILRREEPGHLYYYLYTWEEAEPVLTHTHPQTPLVQAFGLHEYMATETRDAHSNADTVPDRAVVLDTGQVVGFFDARVSPSLPLALDRGWPRKIAAEVDAEARLTPEFEAYPALSAPSQAIPETPFDIFVGFRDDPDPNLPGIPLIHVASPDPKEDCLVLLVADGLTLDREQDYLPLRRNVQTRFTGTLNLKVTEASVKALFIYQGQLIGAAKRYVQSTPEAVNVSTPESAGRRNPCRVTAPSAASYVDITVSVTHVQDGTLLWRLIAPTVPQIAERFFRTTLSDSKQFAADLLRDLKTQNHTGIAARNILETMGQDIAALMPSEFFDILQAVHVTVKRAPTLLWLTNEVYVPWELAYCPQPLDPNAPPFLAAQTQMGRWLEDENVMLPPAVMLDVKRLTAVAARYGLPTGLRELKEALAEQESLCNNWNAVSLEAVQTDMEAMISGPKVPGHLVHFAMHGYSDPAANNQALLLADGAQWPASALTGAYLCGQTPRFAFVFLNACQVGTPGRSLGQAGGFPGILIRRGALGFIAPLWDVHDDVARALAETFYTATLGSQQAVGAVLRAQRCTYQYGSTTPLAYIYYGHPALRLLFKPA
jgi:hypothetical protein